MAEPPPHDRDASRLLDESESPFELAIRSEAKALMEKALGEAAENIVAHNRTMEKRKHWTSVFILVLGVSVMGGLAYFFRQSTFLASIPLVGIVVVLLLWPLFEKFRTLLRFSAEFEPQKIAIRASSTKDDDLVRLRAELNQKKLELQIAEVEHQRRLLDQKESKP